MLAVCSFVSRVRNYIQSRRRRRRREQHTIIYKKVLCINAREVNSYGQMQKVNAPDRKAQNRFAQYQCVCLRFRNKGRKLISHRALISQCADCPVNAGDNAFIRQS